MNTSLWVFWIISALILGAFGAVIWGNIQTKKAYGEGYANGYTNGANEKYHEVYNKRLIRQTQRAAARERKHEPVNPEAGLGAVQGVATAGDSEPGSGTSSLFEHDADAGAGTESSHE